MNLRPKFEVSFAKSVFRVEDLPVPKLPEIAFLGRSNVGKSSLINAFVGQKRLARVSSRPGFTQALNFFRVDHRFLVVDLPGYGFAKAPVSVRKNWQRLIEKYLSSPRPLRLLVLIFDIRRQPDKLDFLLVDYVKEIERRFVVVLNKIDRVKKTELKKRKESWQEALALPEEMFFLTSCRTNEGIPAFRNFVLRML
jgi:GTP-binding protein